jgi:hypothetical protein
VERGWSSSVSGTRIFEPTCHFAEMETNLMSHFEIGHFSKWSFCQLDILSVRHFAS